MIKHIKCTSLKRHYEGDGTKTIALQHVDLGFEKGEFTAVIGPSGSGKSTLLSLIGTLDKPSEGVITYDDEEILKKSKSKSKLADFRFQF
ncbi:MULTISPECIES: ATP-binding cassette domain-containing protein [unclassified Virgibacillus]|uniref:ATP-binding cassette domain-containing protein n=1 Tax=unclassified Virgibacillus TaxID=2620237 RepID=UPI0024DE0FE3|nr:ATP-binding cassette domain-containing protein [Virgibacillus sp. LDC-1]